QLYRLLKAKGRGDSQLFEFHDRTNKKAPIIMVQERFEDDDGKKQYIPWTYWGDGVWRSMEPTHRGLAFWKPAKPRGKTWIMVHEGPKAASFVDRLVNDRAM